MKWGEFKKLVEAEGVTDDFKIDYIDVDGCCSFIAVNKDVRSMDGTKWVAVRG